MSQLQSPHRCPRSNLVCSSFLSIQNGRIVHILNLGVMIPQEELDAMLGGTLGDSSPLATAAASGMKPQALSFEDPDLVGGDRDRTFSVLARETLDELASELSRDVKEVLAR